MKALKIQYKYLPLLAVSSLLLTTCTKDLTIDSGIPRSLVLYPHLEVNEPIKVFAYSSAAITDTGSIHLENPLAYIYEEGNCLDTLLLNAKGAGISKVTAKEKARYTMRVTADKYTAAETDVVMPSLITGLTIDTSSFTEPNRSAYTILKISFNDDASTTDFYRVRIDDNYLSIYFESTQVEFYSYSGYGLILTDEPKHLFENLTHIEHKFGVSYVPGGPFYFNDKLFNGKKASLLILLDRLKWNFKLDNEIKNAFQLRIEVAKISPDFYKGLYSQARYNTNKNQDLPISEEIPIYSSVKGGFGFAAASASVIDTSISNQTYKDLSKHK